MTIAPKRVLKWKQAAIDDLAGIIDHIASDSQPAAERFYREIIERIVQLASFPFSGGPCLEYPSARQLVHDAYVVYYTVTRRDVVIRAVVHGARLFRKSWLRRR
jgi:plasmid stabilization system protein ParE